MAIYLVLKQGQAVFTRRDLYRSKASAIKKADKVNGIVKLGDTVIYQSKGGNL